MKDIGVVQGMFLLFLVAVWVMVIVGVTIRTHFQDIIDAQATEITGLRLAVAYQTERANKEQEYKKAYMADLIHLNDGLIQHGLKEITNGKSTQKD